MHNTFKTCETQYIYPGAQRLNKVCALQKNTNFERSCPSRSRHGAFFTVTSPQHDIILSVVILSRCVLSALIYDYHLKLSSASVRHFHIKGLGMTFLNEKQRFQLSTDMFNRLVLKHVWNSPDLYKPNFQFRAEKGYLHQWL